MKNIGTIFIYSFAIGLHAESLMENEIEHVVVLMLENRSFDNVLAWLYSQENPPAYCIPENGEPFMGLSEETLHLYENKLVDSEGNIVYTAIPIKGPASVAGTPYINSPHTNPLEEYSDVIAQLYGSETGPTPTMSGFLQNFASQWDSSYWIDDQKEISAVMETYTEEELPIIYGLARHYAVSDNWFCSVPTQTNPNRAFAACGTSEGQVVNGPLAKSLFLSDTIWNRLCKESPETSWMIAWSDSMIPGIFSGPLTGPNNFDSMNRIPNLEDHYCFIDEFHSLARRGALPHFTFVEPLWTLSINVLPSSSFVYRLFNSKNEVIGLQGNDLHPPGDMRPGENLLANIYTSLIANGEAWQKTLLIITFDEHGGLFDHVPPPKAVAPDDHFENGFEFDIYGVRVPTIFISPKIQKGGIIRSNKADVPFDHTSLISTILQWRGIPKEKWNFGKRTQISPTFDGIINLEEGRSDAILMPSSFNRKVDPRNIIYMDDKFYLKSKSGAYLSYSGFIFPRDPVLGPSNDKVPLTFGDFTGPLTHGSFLLIQSTDPALDNATTMGTELLDCGCLFSPENHNSGQWWTIKSLEAPYLGAPIYYGDRVYLENHTYLDPSQYIPSRLTSSPFLYFFSDYLETDPITETPDDYWILEKAY
jgi:phospholipase C